MKYHLRISHQEAEDLGGEETVEEEEEAEFIVDPNKGVLPANYNQTIRVSRTLC